MNATRLLILLAIAGSLASNIGALGFEYLGGYAPCELCLLQRWPHWVAAAIGALYLALPVAPLLWAGLATMLTSTGFAIYHSGVQQHWWPGPEACTGGGASPASLSPEELLGQLMQADPVVRCDEVSLAILGIPMPVWNAVLSAGLAGIWSLVLFRPDLPARWLQRLRPKASG